jgi:hypothetical protein
VACNLGGTSRASTAGPGPGAGAGPGAGPAQLPPPLGCGRTQQRRGRQQHKGVWRAGRAGQQQVGSNSSSGSSGSQEQGSGCWLGEVDRRWRARDPPQRVCDTGCGGGTARQPHAPNLPTSRPRCRCRPWGSLMGVWPWGHGMASGEVPHGRARQWMGRLVGCILLELESAIGSE